MLDQARLDELGIPRVSTVGEVNRAATDLPGLFGEKAVALGLLTEKQAAFLVRHQHHTQPRIGSYFVENRILTAQEVNTFLPKMQRHNITKTQRKEALYGSNR